MFNQPVISTLNRVCHDLGAIAPIGVPYYNMETLIDALAKLRSESTDDIRWRPELDDRLYIFTPYIWSQGEIRDPSAHIAGRLGGLADGRVDPTSAVDDPDSLQNYIFKLTPPAVDNSGNASWFDVEEVPNFQASLPDAPRGVRDSFEYLRAKLQAGDSVDEFLREHSDDVLLKNWGIYHFALSAGKKRRGYTAFAHRKLGGRKMYFLEVKPHPKKDQYHKYLFGLLEQVVRHCPEGWWFELLGFDGLQHKFTSKEVEVLTRRGICPIIQIDDKFICPRPLRLRIRKMLDVKLKNQTDASAD